MHYPIHVSAVAKHLQLTMSVPGVILRRACCTRSPEHSAVDLNRHFSHVSQEEHSPLSYLLAKIIESLGDLLNRCLAIDNLALFCLGFGIDPGSLESL